MTSPLAAEAPSRRVLMRPSLFLVLRIRTFGILFMYSSSGTFRCSAENMARQIISITAGTLDIWNLNQEGLSSGDYRKAFFYLFKSPGRVTSGVSGAQLNRTWAKSSFLCSFCFNVLNTVYMKMMLLWLEALLSRRSSLCESPSRVSRGACRSCFDFLLVSRLAKPERTFDFDG